MGKSLLMKNKFSDNSAIICFVETGLWTPSSSFGRCLNYASDLNRLNTNSYLSDGMIEEKLDALLFSRHVLRMSVLSQIRKLLARSFILDGNDTRACLVVSWDALGWTQVQSILPTLQIEVGEVALHIHANNNAQSREDQLAFCWTLTKKMNLTAWQISSMDCADLIHHLKQLVWTCRPAKNGAFAKWFPQEGEDKSINEVWSTLPRREVVMYKPNLWCGYPIMVIKVDKMAAPAPSMSSY